MVDGRGFTLQGHEEGYFLGPTLLDQVTPDMTSYHNEIFGPVPVAYHSFGGWKRSGFGDTDQYGMEGLKFWTKVKKVTARWPDGGGDGSNAFLIPTMG